jgi:hypothetical protein
MTLYIILTTLTVFAIAAGVYLISYARETRREVDGYAATVGLRRLNGESNSDLLTRCRNKLALRGGRRWL